MSIINEALKKTEQHIHQNQDKDSSPAKTACGPNPLLVYTLVLLIGISLSKFIFGMLNPPAQKQKPQPVILASVSQVKTPASPPKETAIIPTESKKAAQPSFILNGIFFSDNDGYALINNQIVRENDLVDGAKVIRISSNTVELANGEKLINLSTGR